MDKSPKHETVFDTDQQQLGDVYAKAFVGFAQQAGNLDQLLGELEAVVQAIREVPKLGSALESPRVGVEEKQGLLEKAFGGKVSNDVLNFLKIVISKGRANCLSAIGGSARRIFDELSGRVVATVTTAESVEDSVLQQIASKLSSSLGKEVDLRPEVDPAIIGGMVVRVGDTVYDGSVTNQLDQVRAKAVKRAADAIRGSIDKFISS